MLTEREQESSSQRASALLDVKCASLCVKTSVRNQTVIIKGKETNGDAACHVGTSKLQYVPLHKAFLIRVQTMFLWHTCLKLLLFRSVLVGEGLE